MSNKKKLLSLLPLLALTSCGGFSLEYIVKGNQYLSPVFAENYYDHWDKELKNASLKATNEVKEEDRILSFNDIGKIDDNYATGLEGYTVDDYGPEHALNKYDDSFNYGVQSKLFDGEVRCLGRYQRVRVQIRNTGFSVRFSKESDELTYFAVQFKAAVDYTKPEYQSIGQNGHHNSSLTSLTVSIYVKEGLEIKRVDYVTSNIQIDNYRTNAEYYYFYAFKLENLSRMVGFSMEYEYSDPEAEAANLDYSLFLYEVFLPYTSWH